MTATIVGAVVVAAVIGFVQPEAPRLPGQQQQQSRVTTKEERQAQYMAALEQSSGVSDFDRRAPLATAPAPGLADRDRAAADEPQKQAAREVAIVGRPAFRGSTVSERGPRGAQLPRSTSRRSQPTRMRVSARDALRCVRGKLGHAHPGRVPHGHETDSNTARRVAGLQGDWTHPWQYDGNGQLFVLISDKWMRVHREAGTTKSVIITERNDDTGAKQLYRMRMPKGWPLQEVRAGVCCSAARANAGKGSAGRRMWYRLDRAACVQIDLTDQKTVGALFGSNDNLESLMSKIKTRQ